MISISLNENVAFNSISKGLRFSISTTDFYYGPEVMRKFLYSL